MKPYVDASIRNFEEGYFKYELCGVVIHIGTLNNGHYWTWFKHG